MNEKEYKVKIETITPDIAKKWLETSPRNRRLNEYRIKKYADDMVNGKWSPATMVVINEDGQLVDAHHRMHAVIKANTSVRMVVFYGLEKKFIPYIDTGRSRSAGDMLAFIEGLDGVSSLKNKSTIARWVLSVRAGDISTMVGFDDIADFVLENTDAVDASFNLYNKVRPVGATLAVGAAAFFILEKGNHAEMIEPFFEKVGTGEDIRSGMPEYALRNAIFANGKRGGGGGRQLRDFYYVLTAWHDKVIGSERKVFRMPKEIITRDLLGLL